MDSSTREMLRIVDGNDAHKALVDVTSIRNDGNNNTKSLNVTEVNLDDELKRMEHELECESPKEEHEVSASQIESNGKEEMDVYNETTENKYHNIKNFKCISAIKEEKELCLKIINYKTKRKADFHCWKIKKELLDNQETFILNLIETERLSLNEYKSMIKTSLEHEQKRLKEVQNDKSLSSEELEDTKRRITHRMNLINTELSEEVNEDSRSENEHETDQQQKEEKPIQTDNNNTKDTNEDNGKASTDLTPQTLHQLTIEDLKLIVDLENLLDEYKSAFLYFKSNDLPELKLDANSKAKIINEGIKAIKSGRGQALSLKDFPPKITPSYICGCSPQEKQTKYAALSNIITAELSKYEAPQMKTEQLYPKLKKQSKHDKNERQQTQNEYTKLKQFQALISKTKEDEWIRCPEYSYIELKEKVEKVNEHIAENCVVIRLSNLTYEYESLFVEVCCEFDSVKKCRIDPVDDKNKTYNMDVVWFMSPKEFRSLYRKTIEVKFYSSGYFFNSLRGEFQLKLHSLKSATSVSERVPVTIKNEMFYVNIHVDIRKSCVEPEMVERSFTQFAITKVYPKFEFIIENVFGN